ncbi:MAG: bifunctional isocitrate dehydrogenase kinase/phosphatase [Xanthomonadales bacterium]|nr:bifunctional isocitrate dehydrogenase kinase/phosphatase [Xanthomonadales bacterium]MBK7146543.1 bifunctional isocitrate dehydrogenase kinase/phosphatase [Xanthomonadales bacterium]
MPDALALLASRQLREGFDDYNARFAAITRRARARFEQREWAPMQADLVERIELYDRCVAETSNALLATLRERAHERAVWCAIKPAFAQAIAGLLDGELYQTFYNTLTRRFFKTRGVDADIEFVALAIEPTDRITHPVARHSYSVGDALADSMDRLLEDYPFAVPYAQRRADAVALAIDLERRLAHWGERPVRAIEMLETVFYRERRAYLVGRVFGADRYAPIVVALRHRAEDGGIVVDAVLTERDDVAVLFGITRSYFMADFETVGDAVVFLKTLLPRKAMDEWYAMLGRLKQAKTERYRHFFRHFEQSPECFVHAPGTKGMVMAVFTLPDYPLVFKVIRDHFAPPKTIARQDVVAKYQLVFKHDRAGRLIDAQEFRHLRFPRSRFAPAVLDELLGGCAESVVADGDDVVLLHCYVERRLQPLNLVVMADDRKAARRAILDYGQAIQDLANANVFPGDLLLKNFGVTRHGRAIFYDYDELCLVTECRFRELPKPSSDDEEMHQGAWFHVDDHDVFPEQFPQFLGLSADDRAALLVTHSEIFTASWWRSLQDRFRASDPPEIAPYPEALRLR